MGCLFFILIAIFWVPNSYSELNLWKAKVVVSVTSIGSGYIFSPVEKVQFMSVKQGSNQIGEEFTVFRSYIPTKAIAYIGFQANIYMKKWHLFQLKALAIEEIPGVEVGGGEKKTEGVGSMHKDLTFDVEELNPENYTFYLVPSLNYQNKLFSNQDFYPDNLVLKFKTDCQSIAYLESIYNIELLPFSEQECDGAFNLGLFPEKVRLEFDPDHRVVLEESYLDIGGQQYFLTPEFSGVGDFDIEERENLDAGFLAVYPPVDASGHKTKFWLFHRSVVREKNNCDLADFNWDQDEYDRCQKELDVINSPRIEKSRSGGRLRSSEKRRIERELEGYSNYFSAEVSLRSELVDSGNSLPTLSLSNPGHRNYISPSMLAGWTRAFISANVYEREKYARWLRFFFLALFTASNFMEVHTHWDIISDLFRPVIGYIKFDPRPYELLSLSCLLNFAMIKGSYELLWSAYSQFIDLLDTVYNNKNYGPAVSSYFDTVMVGILSTFTSIWDILGYFRKELVSMSSLPWPTMGVAERTVHQGRLRGISDVDQWEAQLSQWKIIRLKNMRMEQKRRRKKTEIKDRRIKEEFHKAEIDSERVRKELIKKEEADKKKKENRLEALRRKKNRIALNRRSLIQKDEGGAGAKVNEVHKSAEPAMADSEWQKSYGEGVQAFESQNFGAAKAAYERSLRMAENSLERAYSNSAIADCEFQPVVRYKGQILENARKIRESYNGAKHAEKVGEYVDQHIGQPIGLFNSRATVLIDILARAKESIPKARLFQSEAVEALKSHLHRNELLDDDVNVFLELLKEHVAVLTELKDYVDNTPNEVETFYRIREQIILSKGSIPKAQLSKEARIRRKYEHEFSGSGPHVNQHQLLDDLTSVVGGFRENTSNYSKLIDLVSEQEPANSERHDGIDLTEKYKQVVDILSRRQRLGRRRRQNLISFDNALQRVTEQMAGIAMDASGSLQPLGGQMFRVLLEETSSQVVEMPPDGLCMFHALAVGMQLHWNNLPNRAGAAAYLGSEAVTTRNLFSVLAEIANVHATAFPEDDVIQQVAESFRARPGGSAAWGTNDTLNHYIPPLTGTDVVVLNLSDLSQAEQVYATVYRPDGRVDTLVGAGVNSYLNNSPHALVMAFNGENHWDLIVPKALAQKAGEILRVMLDDMNSQSKR